MNKHLNFLKVALSDKQIGAMTRSSKYVVKTVIKNFPHHPLNRVVEYGPGDGVVTKEILKRMPKDGELIAIETNPRFVKILKDIGDNRLKVVEGFAQTVSSRIKERHKQDVDLVISSIPFTILSPADRERVVANTHKMLRDSGKLIMFQYSPIQLKLLNRYFGKKNIRTQFELRNVPPMFIMSAQKVSKPDKYPSG